MSGRRTQTITVVLPEGRTIGEGYRMSLDGSLVRVVDAKPVKEVERFSYLVHVGVDADFAGGIASAASVERNIRDALSTSGLPFVLVDDRNLTVTVVEGPKLVH